MIIYAFIQTIAKKYATKYFQAKNIQNGFRNFLVRYSIEDNPKTSKDFKKGISILVNYGSPAKKSGVNMLSDGACCGV